MYDRGADDAVFAGKYKKMHELLPPCAQNGQARRDGWAFFGLLTTLIV
jgi:hypothetical protein